MYDERCLMMEIIRLSHTTHEQCISVYLKDLTLYILLRLDVPRARFLFQNIPLSFQFSLANFDDFVAECCSNFL